jgi:hypothetical protein
LPVHYLAVSSLAHRKRLLNSETQSLIGMRVS